MLGWRPPTALLAKGRPPPTGQATACGPWLCSWLTVVPAPLLQLRPLATLDAHREATLGCAFSAPLRFLGAPDAARCEDDASRVLLACGGKDGRVSLWDIYND